MKSFIREHWVEILFAVILIAAIVFDVIHGPSHFGCSVSIKQRPT